MVHIWSNISDITKDHKECDERANTLIKCFVLAVNWQR